MFQHVFRNLGTHKTNNACLVAVVLKWFISFQYG